MSRGPKKSAAARRTSHASRGAARAGAPAAKMTGARKAAGEGVMPGMTSNKKTTQRQGFKTNEFIVYPAHGVGQILAIEEQEIAGRQARAVRHQLHQGQDDAAGSDRQDRVGRHAQAGRGAAGQARARDAQGPRAHQAHHVVAPGAGIRSQDQFRRHRRHRRGRARPLPFGHAAGAVLFGAAALRSRARPAVARDRGGAEGHRDRGDQGDRGGARQGPAPRSQARRRGRPDEEAVEEEAA